jgi:hypothetical protein
MPHEICSNYKFKCPHPNCTFKLLSIHYGCGKNHIKHSHDQNQFQIYGNNTVYYDPSLWYEIKRWLI